MDNTQFIGLEVCQAEQLLKLNGIDNFKFIYYVDRKQTKFDKEIVTAVRWSQNVLQLIVCRYLFEA